MPNAAQIIRVAVPSPLRRLFDYTTPALSPGQQLRAGMRVAVSFGQRQSYGLVVEVGASSDLPVGRLKPINNLVDAEPLIPGKLFKLMLWAADYYQHPVGEVVFGALPTLLRQGKPAEASGEEVWRLIGAGAEVAIESLKRAPRQQVLLQCLHAQPQGLSITALDQQQPNWRPVMRKLLDKGWVERELRQSVLMPPLTATTEPPVLNADQRQAIDAVAQGLGGFQVSLVDGVTGSGKTEVYLSLIQQVVGQGRQVLVLVPEIGLTPQLVARFQARFVVPLVVLHSGLSDRERLSAWVAARNGTASIVIGTRSAVFTPFAKLGLIILDEEHDASFKQQEGFRYSARDVAIKRAQLESLPVVLGTATPSLETLHNAQEGRYQHLVLPERAGAASHPRINVLDMCKQPIIDGLSSALINAMRRHLDNHGQVLLFLNRRGYAPTLLCHDCGWVAKCRRCDAHMTLYQSNRRLRCHHCGAERAVEHHCPECSSSELRPVGAGTERLEERLQTLFPDIGIARIDRDSTRRKGALKTLLDSVHAGENRILVGTQMLAKGHHFPDVTLVGIIDVDQGLFSADFRATERMAQLIVQVSGRAGRAEKPGQVLIQTHHPEHPLLQVLLQSGYATFARAALLERHQAQLPPFSYLALLRAEAADGRLPLQFLLQAREQAQAIQVSNIQLLGPLPAPMERRAGRVRAQLLIQAPTRAALHRLLTPWLQQLEANKLGRKVRWSIDVDPMEMF